MSSVKKRHGFILAIFSCIVLLTPVVVYFAMEHQRSETTEVEPVNVEAPVTLVGDWHQVNGNPDFYMTASVGESSIQINIKTRDSTSLYWMGTFDTNQNLSDEFEIVSQADQDALSMSMFGSPDETKKFVYKDGKIIYDFGIMGTTTEVHLSK